jgi:hypothetical protein
MQQTDKLERQMQYAKILCISLTIFLGMIYLMFSELLARRNDAKDEGWFAPLRGMVLGGFIVSLLLTMGIFTDSRPADRITPSPRQYFGSHSLLVPQRQDGN